MFLTAYMSENRILKAIRGKTQSLEGEMSFFDHLEVLRWHLIRAAIAIVIFACVAFYYFDSIWQNLIMGPKHADFLTYRLLCKLGDLLGNSGICIKQDLPGELQNTELAGQFSMQINASIIIIDTHSERTVECGLRSTAITETALSGSRQSYRHTIRWIH